MLRVVVPEVLGRLESVQEETLPSRDIVIKPDAVEYLRPHDGNITDWNQTTVIGPAVHE